MEKIIGIVTYTDEITVGMAVDSLKSQPVEFSEIVLLDNISPMRTAFNTALDYCQGRCDVAFLLAADTVLKPDVLPKLLSVLEDDVFMVNAKGEDIIFGEHGTGGFFLWNMSIWGNWRYGQGQVADVDLVFHIEEVSNFRRIKINEVVSTHHPIWTPKEMWGRVRFSLPKLVDKQIWIDEYRKFFEREIGRLPENLTLRVGYDLFNLMIQDLKSWVIDDKDKNLINAQFEEFVKGNYDLKPTDFYAMEGWEEKAEKLISGKVKIPKMKVIHG